MARPDTTNLAGGFYSPFYRFLPKRDVESSICYYKMCSIRVFMRLIYTAILANIPYMLQLRTSLLQYLYHFPIDTDYWPQGERDFRECLPTHATAALCLI